MKAKFSLRIILKSNYKFIYNHSVIQNFFLVKMNLTYPSQMAFKSIEDQFLWPYYVLNLGCPKLIKLIYKINNCSDTR